MPIIKSQNNNRIKNVFRANVCEQMVLYVGL